MSVKSARLPLPEKGFKIIKGAISVGIPNALKRGESKRINLSERPLTVKSSVITKTAIRYGKIVKTVFNPFLVPSTKLS